MFPLKLRRIIRMSVCLEMKDAGLKITIQTSHSTADGNGNSTNGRVLLLDLLVVSLTNNVTATEMENIFHIMVMSRQLFYGSYIRYNMYNIIP